MHKSYALIYTLLFIVLLMITVISTWVIGMADIRMQRRNEYSAEATQLAKAAIDDGWVWFKKTSPLDSEYPRPFDSGLSTPGPGACDSPPKYIRINPNLTSTDLGYKTDSVTVNPPPALSLTSQGIYDYRVYTGSCSNSVNTGETTIEGVGYFQGNKITLKATVTHDDEPICTNQITGAISPPPCAGFDIIQTGWNHDKDYLIIYQTGPS